MLRIVKLHIAQRAPQSVILTVRRQRAPKTATIGVSAQLSDSGVVSRARRVSVVGRAADIYSA